MTTTRDLCGALDAELQGSGAEKSTPLGWYATTTCPGPVTRMTPLPHPPRAVSAASWCRKACNARHPMPPRRSAWSYSSRRFRYGREHLHIASPSASRTPPPTSLRDERLSSGLSAHVLRAAPKGPLWAYHRILRGKGCCCCAVGMCENSRQRVIHISSTVAVIFLESQVACAVNGRKRSGDSR